MKQRNNPFLEQLKTKQTRHQSHTEDLSSLSEAELDAEVRRAEQKVREAKEREVIAARDAAENGKRPSGLFPRSNRRPWK